MKLATFRSRRHEPGRVGALVEYADSGPYIADLRAALTEMWTAEDGPLVARERAAARIPEDMRRLLAYGERGLDDCRRALDRLSGLGGQMGGVDRLVAAGTLYAEDAVEFLPVVERPGKIICAGLNYGDHADEAGDIGLERSADSRAFAKFPSVLIGHEAPIRYPQETSQLDYEGELAIVIGASTAGIEPDEARKVIAGYTMFNDVSSRDIQFEEMKAGMLLLGKNPNHSSPLGPYLVTADEIPDPHALDLELKVNGEVRQSGSTGELILGCDQLVAYWSAVGLEPGDVISTGTPAGAGIFRDPPERYLLQVGDLVELRISGLGTLRNRVKPAL